jgi:hypothetical protein
MPASPERTATYQGWLGVFANMLAAATETARVGDGEAAQQLNSSAA